MTGPAKPEPCPHVLRLLYKWRISGGWTEARTARLERILDTADVTAPLRRAA